MSILHQKWASGEIEPLQRGLTVIVFSEGEDLKTFLSANKATVAGVLAPQA